MKKFFYLLLPLFALSLTSCGDNEEEILPPDPQPKKEATQFEVNYNCKPSATYFECYDITATYTDINGKTVSETLSYDKPLNYHATVSLQGFTKPAKYSCKVVGKKKDVTFPEGKGGIFSCTSNFLLQELYENGEIAEFSYNKSPIGYGNTPIGSVESPMPYAPLMERNPEITFMDVTFDFQKANNPE